MEINNGVIITAAAMVVFYLRLAQIRGKKRRLARQEALQRRKNPKWKQGAPLDLIEKPKYQVWSWWVAGLGIALMLVGVMMYTANWFVTPYDQYWWVLTTAGVLVFTISFK